MNKDASKIILIQNAETSREAHLHEVCAEFEITGKKVEELIQSGEQYKGYFFDYPIK